MIEAGGVPWVNILMATLESPIKKEEAKTTIDKELQELRIVNNANYNACILNGAKSRNEALSFKGELFKAFGASLKYKSHVFVNGKLFIPFERGDNPYILQKFLKKK